MNKKIQKTTAELEAIISFPVSVYPTTVDNKYVLLIKQQDTSRALQDWAFNEIYPMFWKVRAYLKKNKLLKQIVPVFFCDEKLVLFSRNNNVLTEMNPMPRGEWFNAEENTHFLGYCSNIKRLITFLTETPKLKF